MLHVFHHGDPSISQRGIHPFLVEMRAAVGCYGPIDKSSVPVVWAKDRAQARSGRRLLQKIPRIVPWSIVFGGWVVAKARKQCHWYCGGLYFVAEKSPFS